jgi:hypothetical protein
MRMEFEGDPVTDSFVKFARGPDSSPGLRAAFAREGLPLLKILCAANTRKQPHGRELGGVWRTREGAVLAYNKRMPGADDLFQAKENFGARVHEELLYAPTHVLLAEATDVEIFCPRHGVWPLDMNGVRKRLQEGRVLRKLVTLGTKPPPT